MYFKILKTGNLYTHGDHEMVSKVPTFAVIMAGGRGERFWPECRIKRPKQLLNLFGEMTLIEQTVLRLQGLVPQNHILIVSNQAYVESIRRLLPDIPEENIIGEPISRDTAPCVALAAGIVKAKAHDDNAVMLLLPADHCIVNSHAMVSDLQQCIAVAADHDAIATIGIKPFEPSPNYGYIKYGEPLSGQKRFFHVHRFTEKPSMEVARIFLADGNYKWNSGMFIFSVKTIWKEMRRQNLSLFTFAETIAKRWNMEGFSAVQQEEFKKLPKISFDYAIMEHAQEVLVSDANFDWDDIGNWTAISNHYEHDDANNVIHANAELLDCHDCIVFSHDKEKLITGIDLHGLVVVQTPDATLVAPAHSTAKIKELLKQLSTKMEKQKFL